MARHAWQSVGLISRVSLGGGYPSRHGYQIVNVDRDTPMLLPPDLREWVPDEDMVHFIIEAVAEMNLPTLKINRLDGSAQAETDRCVQKRTSSPTDC